MTNREAIEVLVDLNDNYFSEGFDEANEAILLAIESLNVDN